MHISKLVTTVAITLFTVICSFAQVSDSLYKALPDSVKPKNRAAVTDKEIMRMILNTDRPVFSHYVTEFKTLTGRLETNIQKITDDAQRTPYAQGIAGFYAQTGDMPKQEFWYRKVIEYGEGQPAYRAMLSNAYLNTALSYSYHQKLDSAVDLLQKAVTIATADHDTATLGDSYYVYISIYSNLKLEQRSIEYCNKYLATFSEKDKWSQPYTEITLQKARNYIYLFHNTGNTAYTDTAQMIIRQTMEATRKNSDYWYQNCYKLLGLLYYYSNDFSKAVVYYDSMFLPKYTKEGSHEGSLLYVSRLDRALSLLQLGHDSALKEILSINIPQGDYASRQEINLVLSKYYAKKGDYKEALGRYMDYKKYLDSSNLIAQRGVVFEAQQKYAVAEKEVDISRLEKKNLAQRNMRNTILFSAIAVILLMLLGIAVLYIRNRQQKVQRLAERQKLTDDLYKMEQDKDKTITAQRQDISRDMHDEVSSGLAVLRYMVADSQKSAKTEEAKKILGEIEDEVNTVYLQAREFLHRLHHSTKAQKYNVLELLTGLSLRFGADSSLHIITKVDDEKIEALFTPLQHEELYCIIKEAVANCMKHSKADTISIDINEQQDYFYFAIEDNGGRPLAAGNPGIGLAAMQDRIYLLDGKIQMQFLISGLKIDGSFPVRKNTF